MNFTVYVVDWNALGPVKFWIFMMAVLIYSGWSQWRHG